MKQDHLIKETLGEHIYYNFLEAKEQEWKDYSTYVTEWELEKYLYIY
jgi:glutamine synthetase